MEGVACATGGWEGCHSEFACFPLAVGLTTPLNHQPNAIKYCHPLWAEVVHFRETGWQIGIWQHLKALKGYRGHPKKFEKGLIFRFRVLHIWLKVGGEFQAIYRTPSKGVQIVSKLNPPE